MAETKIDLGNGWSIEADASCWILKEHRPMKNVKEGNPDTYANSHYYPTLESGLKSFVDHKAKELADKKSAKEIVAVIEAVGKQIHDALQNYVKANGSIEDSERHGVMDQRLEKSK